MAPSVTITGNFKDLAGNAVSSGTVTAQLTGYGSQTPVVAGVGIIDSAQQHISEAIQALCSAEHPQRFGSVEDLLDELRDCHRAIDELRYL